MIKYRVLLIFYLSGILQTTIGQTTINIEFSSVFGEKKIIYDSCYYSKYIGDCIIITKLKYYISDLSFIKNDKIVYKSEKIRKLIDLEKNIINVKLEKETDFDEILFQIGIDSITNVSGAMDGDLDPINGMYWTWQSGYINFKLEGKSKIFNTPNNEFFFHIGGYQFPYNASKIIKLKVMDDKHIKVLVDIEKLLQYPEILKVPQIMSPGKQAILFTTKLSEIFSIE